MEQVRTAPLTDRVRQYLADQRVRHRAYVTQYGEDLPEVRDWRWEA